MFQFKIVFTREMKFIFKCSLFQYENIYFHVNKRKAAQIVHEIYSILETVLW